LAEDAVAPGELHDVVHDEEVAGEVLRLDHGEFLLQPVAHIGVVPRVGPFRALPDQVAQPTHRRVPVGHMLPGQPGPGTPQREGELVGQGHGAGHGPRVPAEPRRHLRSASQVLGRRSREPAVHVVQAAVGAHGGQGREEREVRGLGIVHVVGGEHGQPGTLGQGGQGVVGHRVLGPAVVEEFHVDRVPAEEGDQGVEFAGCCRLPVVPERLADRAGCGAGEDAPVPAGEFGEFLDVVDGPALFSAGHLPAGERRSQAVVALLAPGQHDQAGALGFSDAFLRPAEPERELRPEDRAELGVALRGLGQADGPVEPVVVGEGQAVQAELPGLLEQALG
jgi:hypothetical protein